MKNRVDILHKNLVRYFDEVPLVGNSLVVDDFPDIPSAQVPTYWHTHFHTSHTASPTPSHVGPYDNILIRLPKSHEYFNYILRCITSLLAVDSTVYIYGLNDEGIKGAQKKLEKIFADTEAVHIKNKGRIVACRKIQKSTELHCVLADFGSKHSLTYSGRDYDVTYYPGMFAAGELDAGTKLLLDVATSQLKNQKKILDYASGSGIIAKVLSKSLPAATFDLLDNDTISLAASQINVPQAQNFILGETLAQCPKGSKYDLIISNPPIHTGKSHQRDTLFSLIEDSKKHLAPRGQLLLVTQARIPLNDIFMEHFTAHTIVSETTRFKVWEGRM